MQNTFCVVTNKRQLSLRFIVTGDNADLVLLQTRENLHPGVIDQHVYSLKEVDHLQDAVEEKIVSHLLS
jgi:hypothetical protein